MLKADVAMADFLGMLVLLVGVGHTRPLSAAERDIKDMSNEELLAAMKNPNRPPVIMRLNRDQAVFPPNYDWKAQARVIEAWKALHDRFDKSLPALVAHMADEDYSLTLESGQTGSYKNYSVGRMC